MLGRDQANRQFSWVRFVYSYDNSDFETYAFFFDHLRNKLSDSALKKLVICSDDEKALVKATTTSFYSSKHVLCTRHLRQRAQQKLIDDAITLSERQEILEYIFGENGLINTNDAICYQVMS